MGRSGDGKRNNFYWDCLKARLNGISICPTFVQQKLNGCWDQQRFSYFEIS